MFVSLSSVSLISYNPHGQLQPVPIGSRSCVPLVASGKAERSLIILSPKARHFACIASEISLILDYVCCLMVEGRYERSKAIENLY